MREYQSLTLEGYPLYANQTFDFSSPGISVVLGLNLNGKTNKSASAGTRNTNAVGKSLFFSALKDIAFKAGSSGNAKDKPKRGKATLALKVKGTDFVLQRYLSGKSEKFLITRSGEDWTPKDTVEQRARIEKILGRDEDTFSVIDYLESTAHLIRSGDTGARRTFFTNFFNLTRPDWVKKIVEEEVDRLKLDAVRLKELSQQLEANAEDKTSVKEVKERLAETQLKLEARQAKLQRLRDARDFNTFCLQYAAPLKICVNKDDRMHPNDRMAELTRSAKSLRRYLREEAEHTQYQEDLAAWRRDRTKRKAYIEKHSLDLAVLPVLRKDWENLVARLSEAKQEELDASGKMALYSERLTSNAKDLERAKTALAGLTKNKDCSKCGQPVTNEHYKKERAELLSEIEELREAGNKLHAKDAACLEARNAAEKTVHELTHKEAKLNRVLDVYAKMPTVQEKPEPPEDGLDFPADWDSDAAKAKLQKLKSQIEAVEVLLPFSDLAPLRKWLAGDDSSFDEDAYDTLTAQVLELAQEVAGLEQKLASSRERREERARIQSRINELQEGLKHLDEVRVLEKAFASNAGVKQLQINSACQALEGQVNKYAAYLFPEPYTFEFDLTTQFQILVTRKVGTENETSDVRKLSGAEAPLFDLTLALALISFLPKDKRSNVMILDEMDAKFGPAVSDLFVRFLPVLAKVVPHIVVITPKVDVNYGERVRYFTVVKEGAHSRIVPGRHLSADTLPKSLTKPRKKAA